MKKDLVDEKATRHDITRHCEEGKRSAARRGNLLNGLLRHFVPRNDGDSSNSKSLLNVKHLARVSRGRALSAKMTKSLQTTSADPFNASEQDFTYSLIHLFTCKCKATQIIRGAAKARFRRTLRAGLADARTAPYRKFGFTLAEVLITLGVIGIVAAMTIPNLVQSYKKKEVETKLVKFYSMMNNAIKMAEADYGDPGNWVPTEAVFGNETDENGEPIPGTSKQDVWFQKYLAPYLKIEHKIINPDSSVRYYFADGSILSIPKHTSTDWYFLTNSYCDSKHYPSYESDAFGAAGSGSCLFVFVFYPSVNNSNFKYHYKKGMEPTKFQWDGQVSTLKDKCYNKTRTTYCGALIQSNNWKIPEDYPYKF